MEKLVAILPTQNDYLLGKVASRLRETACFVVHYPTLPPGVHLKCDPLAVPRWSKKHITKKSSVPCRRNAIYFPISEISAQANFFVKRNGSAVARILFSFVGRPIRGYGLPRPSADWPARVALWAIPAQRASGGSPVTSAQSGPSKKIYVAIYIYHSIIFNLFCNNLIFLLYIFPKQRLRLRGSYLLYSN